MKKTSNSRRTFLKTTALGTVGLTMGLSAKSYGRILGANDRVNVGIVGFSNRAKGTLIPNLLRYSERMNFDIIGVSDIWNRRRNEGTENLKEHTGHEIRKYRNNEELYDDPDIDAVIISTADFQHALHTVQAAEAGKDAYVEKPFAETMEDNRKAMRMVKSSGLSE